MNAPGVEPLARIHYQDLIRRALAEDLGDAGDITTAATVPAGRRIEGRFVARQAGRVCGLGIALDVVRQLDPGASVSVTREEGADVAAGEVLAVVASDARALLAAERTALNLLGRMSGIATATRDICRLLDGFPTRISCTRKTTPGLRALEKYAVRVGGGVNHRFGLYDAVLIKDNHRELAGGVAESVRRARRAVGHLVKIEVEVDDLAQLDEALGAGADVILLDNMTLHDLRQAVTVTRGRAVLEASGGIRPETVRAVADAGVDLISVGWLTHSAPAMDVSLEVTRPEH